MATTLSKVFPRLDKICDAAFIKRALGTTKKDSVVFISDNQMCRDFFTEKEAEIDRHNELVREDIMQFLQDPRMQLEVAKFKSIIKEKVAKEKLNKKDLEKQAIIEEFLREQEKAKKDAEDRVALGLPPKSGSDGSSSQNGQNDTNNSSTSTSNQNNQNNQNNQKNSHKSDEDNESSSSEETVLQLDDFVNMLKTVHEQGHIVFKNGDTVLNNVQIKLDKESEKIIIQTKPAPLISIKTRNNT